ncbi:MAG: MinD/ParA family protein [Alphaproteobacteria bacterium]
MTTATTHLSAPARFAPRPKVIAIASGKGGVGKTWFAITLAHALARAGRRVLLFDGDLGLANLDVQLGLMPAHDLAEVLAGRISMADAVTRFEGIDIVAGRSGSGHFGNLPTPRILSLRDDIYTLSASYDHAIVDLGAGIADPIRMLDRRSGPCLVLTTDEPTALTDAYAFMKIAYSRLPGMDMRVVVNMAAGHPAGERTHATLLRACETFLKKSPTLAGVIRRDARIADCIRNQTPLLTRHPSCDAAADVEDLARRLAETDA